jgi:hypothetical protein
MSSTRATIGRLSCSRLGRIGGVKVIDRTRLVAWACLMSDCSLVAWQATPDRGSDMLFITGVVAMIRSGA